MVLYNPGVDTNEKSSDFIVCYIKNNELSTQEQILVANDFDFHNGTNYYFHDVKTCYSKNPILDAKELGYTKILCVGEGLIFLNRYIQLIKDENYQSWNNWSTKYLRWINLETSDTQDVPSNIQNFMTFTKQDTLSVQELYYSLITQQVRKWYVTNTEDKEFWVAKQHSPEIFVTAGACSFAISAYINFHKPGFINVIDNCSVAHHMVDYIHKNWDGENYYDFIMKVYDESPQLTADFTAYEKERIKQYSDFLDYQKFKEKWHSIIKPSKIKYFHFDLLSGDDIIEKLDTNNCWNMKIDFSNAFNYYPSACFVPKAHRYKQYMKVVNKINEKNNLPGFRWTFGSSLDMEDILTYNKSYERK